MSAALERAFETPFEGPSNAPSILPPPLQPPLQPLARDRSLVVLQRKIWVRRHPLERERHFVVVPEGTTIADMLTLSPAELGQVKEIGSVKIFLDGHEIPAALWPRVTPKQGAEMQVVFLPGKSGKTILTVVLVIAVLAFAAYAGPIIGPALLGGQSGTFLGLTASQFGTALVGLVGKALIAALVKPSAPGSGASPDLSSVDVPVITGISNRANPGGPVPNLFGRRRLFPPLGAQRFTEIVGNKQFERVLMVIGLGPCDMSDFKLGNTPFTEIDGLEWEVREGWPTDPPRTLYANSVTQETFNIKLASGDSQIRVAPATADELIVFMSFPLGLVRAANSGRLDARALYFRIEYRLFGSSDPWVAFPEPRTNAPAPGTTTLDRVIEPDPPEGTLDWVRVPGGKTRRRFSFRAKVAATGLYEVRMKRLSDDPETLAEPNKWFIDSFWTGVQSILYEDPIKLATPVATLTIRAQADEQIRGRLDTVSLIAERYVQIWDGAAWNYGLTRDPAWAYVEALTGPGNFRKRPLSSVPGDLFLAWANRNAGWRLEYDMVVDTLRTLHELLDEIAAAGLAFRTNPSDQVSIALDERKTTLANIYTPRNSFGFNYRKLLVKPVHGLKVRYLHPLRIEQVERIVYAPGFNKFNATVFEVLKVPGNGTWRGAGIHGRYRLEEYDRRDEEFSWGCDFENLVNCKGQVVGYQNETIAKGLGDGGRIKSVTLDGGSNLTGFSTDATFPQEPAKSYAFHVRMNDAAVIQVPVTNQTSGQAESFRNHILVTPLPPPVAGQPALDDLVAYGELGIELLEGVINAIRPGPNLTAQITCVNQANEIFDALDGEDPTEFDPGISLRPDLRDLLVAPPVPVVQLVVADETALFVPASGIPEPRVLIILAPAPAIGAVPDVLRIEARDAGENAWDRRFTFPATALEFELEGFEEGVVYDFRLRYERAGVASTWTAVITHLVSGKTNPPPDVPTLFLENDKLRWNYPDPPADLAGFILRHQSGNNRAIAGSVKAHEGILTANEFDISQIPRGTRSFLVTAIDSGGRESVNPAVLVRDLGGVPIANIVLTEDHDALGFPGTVTNGSLVGAELRADSNGTPMWTDPADVMWSDPNDAMWTNQHLAMTYQVDHLPPSDLLDAALTLGLDIDGESWFVEYRLQGEQPMWSDPADAFWSDPADPMWDPPGDWRAFSGSITSLQRQLYQLRLVTAAARLQGVIRQFDIVLDVPDITERFEDVALAAGGTRVVPAKITRKIVRVNPSLQDDGGAAVSILVKDKNVVLGSLIQAIDGSRTGVAGLSDVELQGY